jgi:hypothetical protein
VQLAQCAPHDITGKVSRRQHRKSRRREHERKEYQPADPDDEREQHEKSQEGHDEGLYAQAVMRGFKVTQATRFDV